ncbi:MAG: HEAT repeat domain-containing protein [Clostridia bacterium]
MNSQMLVVIIILGATALLCVEYLWLYIVANRQEEAIKKQNEYERRIFTMLEAILACPTDTARIEEIDKLIEYIENDYTKFDIAAEKLLWLNRNKQEFIPGKQHAIELAIEKLDPVERYQEYFDSGDTYLRGYICRRFADYGAAAKRDEIRTCMDHKNLILQYNAAMALSELGDAEYVITYIKRCEDNKKYSHRVIIELLNLYTGDKAMLAKEIFAECSDYMMATIIKGLVPDKLTELKPIYVEGVTAKSVQIRIASIKALSVMATLEDEHLLIIALNDKDWVVRSSAIRGLQAINTPAAVTAVEHATGDPEWWVRQIAAKALIEMDGGMSHVEAVLKGYDKYASDAVKSSITKEVNMEEV